MFEHLTTSDGGLATQLEALGADLSSALWSARLLRDDPDAVLRAHRAFVDVGAQVVTVASYQASYDGFAAVGIDRAGTDALIRRSVELARSATGGRDVLVAASLGPYGATLADGSEYRGRYGLSVAQLREWHAPRLEVLADAGADLLAVETIPDVDEAEAVVDLLRGTGVRAWLSYSVADGRTRAGQSLEDAFAVARGVPEVVAVGVNCCAPEEVSGAIRAARGATEQPVVAYPNTGETWDAQARAWRGAGRSLAGYTPEWVEAGATVVGGCCRVGPAEVAAVAETLGALS